MKRKFRFNLKVTIFTLLCLVAFVHLGFWQLEREVDKREMLEQHAARLLLPPAEAGKLPAEGDLEGLPILLTGEYNQPSLLLDNRVLQGKVGFEAHQLFLDDSGLLFLVNRGFVPMGRTREDKPIYAEVHNNQVKIRGRIYQPDEQMVILHNETGIFAEFPSIVQQIDIQRMVETLGKPVYPFVIRLDEDQFGALPRYWPSTVMSPAKHRGYAIQWFAMAIAVVIAWLFFSFRRDLRHE